MAFSAKERLSRVADALSWLVRYYAEFRKVAARQGLVALRPVRFSRWHLGSRTFIGTFGRTEVVFVKTSDNRAMVANELMAIQHIRSVLDDAPWLPRVVAVQDQGKFPMIATKWIEGEPLDKLLDNNSKLDAVRFAEGLIEILDGLFEATVVHRDLTPSNILVGNNGRPSLVDYAFAAIRGSSIADETVPVDVLAALGDGLQVSSLRWDDAFSAAEVMGLVGQGQSGNWQAAANRILSRVGRLTFASESRTNARTT